VSFDLNKVLVLANQVRLAFEEIGSLSPPSLVGFCGRASIQLHLAAKRHGIKVDLCVGSGHMYCMFGQDVIDVTATQFGMEDKVFHMNLLKLARTYDNYYYWDQFGRYKSFSDLIAAYPCWCSARIDSDKVIVMKHTNENESPVEATI